MEGRQVMQTRLSTILGFRYYYGINVWLSRSRQIACLEDEVDGAGRLLEFFTATRSTGNPVSTLRDAVWVFDPDTSVQPNMELCVLELKSALDKSLAARASLEARLDVAAKEREAL